MTEVWKEERNHEDRREWGCTTALAGQPLTLPSENRMGPHSGGYETHPRKAGTRTETGGKQQIPRKLKPFPFR